MKKRLRILGGVILIAAAALCLSAFSGREYRVSDGNAKNVVRLLETLVNARERPSAAAGRNIAADLERIREVSQKDHEILAPIAAYWEEVYLDPDFEIRLYREGEEAQLAEEIPNSRTHAFVVLDYALTDGEMAPELMGRCDAAAAAAKARPETVVICSGGATGENNPDGHTEAGLMKDYLTGVCGIDPARIFIDESAMNTAENAANSFRIMRRLGVRTMTIVTSSYHQRRGQVLYRALSILYRERYGYSARIVSNYSYDIEPPPQAAQKDARICAMQLAQILGVPEEDAAALRPRKGTGK